MKLTDYAKKHEITYRTALNHFKADKIQGAYQLPTGTIVVPDQTDWIIIEALPEILKEIIEFCKNKGCNIDITNIERYKICQ